MLRDMACICPETYAEECINGMIYVPCSGDSCDLPCEPSGESCPCLVHHKDGENESNAEAETDHA